MRQPRAPVLPFDGWVDLESLCDPGASQCERRDAFERLLAFPRGWWGEKPLAHVLMEKAEAIARQQAATFFVCASEIDWEGCAQDALLALFARATEMRRPLKPMAWLVAVLENKVLDQVREVFRHRHSALRSGVPLSERIDDEFIGRHRKELQTAIQTLPDATRTVAELLILESRSRDEVAAALHIREATLRKRISRLMLLLHSRLNSASPVDARLQESAVDLRQRRPRR